MVVRQTGEAECSAKMLKKLLILSATPIPAERTRLESSHVHGEHASFLILSFRLVHSWARSEAQRCEDREPFGVWKFECEVLWLRFGEAAFALEEGKHDDWRNIALFGPRGSRRERLKLCIRRVCLGRD
eukprot:scaffold5526_cov149-Ochromonas_danica.AAC.4